MNRRATYALILAGLAAGILTFAPATASPDTSPRPIARSQGPMATVRPQPRPAAAPARQLPGSAPLRLQAGANAAAGIAFFAPEASIKPQLRPPAMEGRAFFKRRHLGKGMICGDRAIQGEQVGRVPGKLKGCGLSDAVRVRSVAGVRLSQPAVMDCTTAKALRRWVDNGVRLAFRPGGKVVELKVAAHYACRTRNNKPGAKISEHGRGRAIDISGFVLRDGEIVTVAKGWKSSHRTRKMLQRAWKTACGPFGTVLGPNADRYHRDHFHLDTARYRSGPYCR